MGCLFVTKSLNIFWYPRAPQSADRQTLNSPCTLKQVIMGAASNYRQNLCVPQFFQDVIDSILAAPSMQN